jgi:hypothetical protein
MTWEEIRQRKEDSIRESTGNPMPKPIDVNGKTYKSFTDYLNSEEYKEFLEMEIRAIEEYKQKAKEYFESLEVDNQLLLFFHITNTIFENYFKDGGSYRGLLYDKFGFGPESYTLGIDSGMFELHNSIFTPEELNKNIQETMRHFNLDLNSKSLQSFGNIIKYGCDSGEKLDNLLSGQQKFDFEKDPE